MMRYGMVWLAGWLLTATTALAATAADIEQRVASMDTATLLSQTLLLGYNANDRNGVVSRSNAGLKKLVEDYHPGGVVLFKRNFDFSRDAQHARQHIHRLITDLQAASLFHGDGQHGIPLFVSVDHEGGSLLQLKKGVTRIPSAMHIATSRNAPLAFRVGQLMGRDLYALGFNMLLGPVADINNNDEEDVIGKRAYGSNKELVAQMASAVMEGIQSASVLAVVKHYPGHGDSRGNPHFTLPVIQYQDPAALEQWDLYPFRYAIDHGAAALMTSHLLVPALDQRLPVSLSDKAIARKLRQDMGFKGLVISDDIGDMLAVTMNKHQQHVRSRFDATRMALEADTDMVMVAHIYGKEDGRHPERTMTTAEFARYYRQLLDYFDATEERREILRRHVRRILLSKQRFIPPAYDKARDSTGFPSLPVWNSRHEDEQFARSVAEQAVVLISARGKAVFHLEDQQLFHSNGGIIGDQQSHDVVIASPVYKDDELGDSLGRRLQDIGYARPSIVHMVYGYKSKDALAGASRRWGEKVERLYYTRSNGQRKYNHDAIQRKADEIVAALSTKQQALLIFGMVTVAQGKVLEAVLRHEKLAQHVSDILVLLYKEPYHLARTVYENPLVSVISLPAFPDLRIAADVLAGSLSPKPVSYLPFNVPGMIDRARALGKSIVPLATSNAPAPADHYSVEQPGPQPATSSASSSVTEETAVADGTAEGIGKTQQPRPAWELLLEFAFILILAMAVTLFMRKMELGKPVVIICFVLVLIIGTGIMGFFTSGEVLGLIRPLLGGITGEVAPPS